MSTLPLRVALRADASAAMGFGHVKRCLALATALRGLDVEPWLVTRRLGADAAALARTDGIDAICLPAPTSQLPADADPHAAWAGVAWDDDAQQTIAALAGQRPDWIVVDQYAFDARWHRRVADATGARIAVIDDLGDRDLDADLLVDQNLHADHRRKYDGHWSADRPALFGPRYALLGTAFARPAPPPPIDAGVRSIGIFMGGADAAGLTVVALRACREVAGFDGPIEVVASSSQRGAAQLAELAARWPATRLLSGLPDLAGFFRRHGLQIGAGGGACWERCCVGAPSIVLEGAANQRAVIPGLVAAGAVVAIDAADAEAVGLAVRELLGGADRRRALRDNGRRLVDGLGARRVALALGAGTLRLRRATPQDAELAHAWRDRPETRRHFRDPRPVALDDHLQWWHRMLSTPSCRLFVAHVGAVDVGVLRLDIDGTAATVSIYLDPALTGLGLGPAVLQATQRWLADDGGAVRTLHAEVLAANAASASAFARAGFRPDGEHWTWSLAA